MIPLLALLLPLPAPLPESLSAAPQGGRAEPAWQELFPDGELGDWRVVGGDGVYSFEEEDGVPVLYGRGATGRNTFLVSPFQVEDFELEIDVKIEPGGNSGIQFRSHVNEQGRLYGYQAEIDPSERAWSAGIYDEGRRGWLDDLSDNDAARAAFRVGEWNTFRILARGPLLRTWVNGVPAADLYDDADLSGYLALQVHSGGRTHVRWRDARYRAFFPDMAVAQQGGWTAMRAFGGQPEVPVLGTPGTMAVWGSRAFPMLLSADPPVPVAGYARWGDGQVFAIAHGGYAGETQPIRAHVIELLAGGKESPRVLDWRGDGPDAEALADCDVLVMTGVGPLSEERAFEVRRWVGRGGALYAAVCPWGWQQVSARRGWELPDDLGENQLLTPMGLSFADGYAKAAGDGKFRLDPRTLMQGYAFGEVYQGIAASGAGGVGPAALDGMQHGEVLEHAVRNVSRSAKDFWQVMEAVTPELDDANAPRPGRALPASSTVARLAVVAYSERWPELPPEEVEAAPGAEYFPGAVDADAERIVLEAAVAGPAGGWVATTGYLPAGEVLRVSLLEGAADGWRIRVGCHKDTLWHKDRWSRWPEITGEWPLRDGMELATPFGGIVYLVPGRDSAGITVGLDGVVLYPRYQPGMTAERWQAQLAESGAPWAELEGEHIVLSVPTEAAALLDDPGPLMAFWDSVMEAHCKLGAEPLPLRKERLVADAQISAGYMHAGYPIMTWLDVVEIPDDGGLPVVLDLETLRTKGNWGYFHELGHNRQEPEWTFGGTGEVTCNWFSLHAGDLLCGIEPWRNPWLENQKRKGAAYLEAGADYAKWRSSPGIALLCYAQVQREFGWQPFYDVLGEYRALPAAERPRNDQQKRDAWVRRMSLATERDLRPFHAAWGWPLGEALLADEELDALQPWGETPESLLD